VKRLTQLDGIRGVAIAMVLVWHYLFMQLSAPPGSVLWFGQRALILTWSGVDLFFVLSGFLIAGILVDHCQASNYFRVFYLRRACRILPLYYLLLAICVACRATGISSLPRFGWLFAGLMPLWSYATFTQNLFMGIRNDFGGDALSVTWSLAVEEQFYIVIPMLIYVFRRRFVFWVLLAGVVAAPLLRSVLPLVFSFASAPCCADALLSGACLAILVRSERFLSSARRHPAILTGLTCVFLLGAVLLTVLGASPFDSFTHFWLAGLFTLVILSAYLQHTWLVRVLELPALVWLGRRSYGVYLLHLPIQGLLFAILLGRTPKLVRASDLVVSIAALAATLGLAALSFRYFESSILRFGHSFAYSDRPDAAKVEGLGGTSAGRH
jgi:peptidoglycan/LPS O-acetylase OafA/YrhL